MLSLVLVVAGKYYVYDSDDGTVEAVDLDEFQAALDKGVAIECIKDTATGTYKVKQPVYTTKAGCNFAEGRGNIFDGAVITEGSDNKVQVKNGSKVWKGKYVQNGTAIAFYGGNLIAKL